MKQPYTILQPEHSARALAYSEDFRQHVAKHKLSLQRFVQLADMAEATYAPANVLYQTSYEDHELVWNAKTGQWEAASQESYEDPCFEEYFHDHRDRIFRMGTVLRDKIADVGISLLSTGKRARYFYAQIGHEEYFIKNLYTFQKRGAVDEFKRTVRAKLFFSQEPDVEIAEPAFAYQEPGISWFASHWKDLSVKSGYIPANAIGYARKDDLYYNEHFEAVGHDLPASMTNRFEERYGEILNIAFTAGFIDAQGNIDYNPSTEKFYLYDF